MTALLGVQNLSVRFKRDEHVVQAVDDLSFQVERGEMLAIVGESGSGKSVTARAIMRLLPRTATLGAKSHISFAGTRIERATEGQMLGIRGNHISMIFQEPMSSLDPIYRIGDQICEGIIRHQRLTKKQAMAQGARPSQGGADSRSRRAAAAVPASALGRPAPARDDCHRDRQQSRAADRR